MHVILEPVFSVPTDGMIATTIVGTDSGRIFIGGRDGNLYEIVYQVTIWLPLNRFIPLVKYALNFSFSLL